MILVLLLYALFASVFTIAKTGLTYTEPLFFVGTRMFFAGIVLLGYQWYSNRESIHFKKLPWKKLAYLALFNIYLTNVFEFWGLKYLTSFKTCFIYSLSPFVSAILSYLIFSERISGKKAIGLIIGFLGLFPILLTQTTLEEETGKLLFFSWAEIAVIGAAISSVYGWILLKQLVHEEKCSPPVANGFSMLIGGVLSLLHSAYAETWNPIPVQPEGYLVFVECSLLLILISNLICYNLYGHLLKKHSATFMSFAGFSTPFFTAFFGWIYLGEVVTWHFYLSAVIVFLGLLLFYKEELQKAYISSPVQNR